MVEIGFEWERAAGVGSDALARTWARIEFRVEGRPMTRFWSEDTQSLRSGVYGSLLPLAAWIARNWWVLLFQGSTARGVSRGPRSSRSRAAQKWFRHHNLLFAREGMAYPDLSIMRLDGQAAYLWNGDPGTESTAGRFLDSGRAVGSLDSARAQLARVVVAVIERTAAVEGDATVDELRSDWDAVVESTRSEFSLCQKFGVMGIDPYQAEGATSSIDALEASLDALNLEDLVLADLLAASTPQDLGENQAAAQHMIDALDSGVRDGHNVDVEYPRNRRAYVAGFERARQLREQLDLDPEAPIRDLDDIVSQVLGTRFELRSVPGEGTAIEGVVQANGAAGAVVAERSSAAGRRFHMARVVHHALFAASPTSPTRLLTKSHDWQQSASRSFAAELLAPAAGLEARIGPGTGWDADTRLAKVFRVSPRVIRHQLENHAIT